MKSRILHRSARSLVLLVALGVLVAACGGSSEEPSGSASGATGNGDDVCTTERVGGKITMSAGNATDTLDPVTQNSGSRGGPVRAAIYDTLMVYNPATNEYSPHLAESLEGSDDATEWTLTLRDDITYADGTVMTPEAVKQNIERHGAEGSPSNSNDMVRLIDEIEIVDDVTITFHMKQPFGSFPFVLAGNAGQVINPNVLSEQGDDFGMEADPNAGVGPYTVKEFIPEERVVLESRDDYWGGTVCIEEITFTSIPGAAAAYEAFELDEVQIALLGEAPVVKKAVDAGTKGFTSVGFATAEVLINNGRHGSKPPTTDIRLREAITVAIDPDLINERRWEGAAIPSTALVPAETGSPLSPDIDGPQYDPDRAKELIEEVKADGWDGQLDLVCPNDPAQTEGAIAIKALLEAAGASVDLHQVTVGDLIDRVIVDSNYDIACWGLGIQASNPSLGLTAFDGNSESNYAGYVNEDFDAALGELRSAIGNDAQREAMAKIQTVWNETFPSAVYASDETFIAISDQVKGVTPTSWTTIMFHDAYLG